ncbi:MAG: transketolase C-terminal domain-containing protein [Angelakisella sp.]
MWKLSLEQKLPEQRQIFADTLIDIMNDNDRVMMLEADLGGASLSTKVQKAHPSQFINVGIAEANMTGIAAGLSMVGYVPFIHTFTPFVARRALDQLFLSGAYAGNNIKVYASDPGICVGVNGGTHTSFEDIAAIRAIPTAMVFDPADGVQLEWLIRTLIPIHGVHYIRTSRKAMPSIYEKGSTFTLGKGNVLKDGSDVLLLAMGETLYPSLQAAFALEKEGISVEVIDVFTVKPIDAQLILTHWAGKKLVVTAENHSIIGGLGSAVAELLAEQGSAPRLHRIGITDRFGQVGSTEYLAKEYGLDKDSIIKSVHSALR